MDSYPCGSGVGASLRIRSHLPHGISLTGQPISSPTCLGYRGRIGSVLSTAILAKEQPWYEEHGLQKVVAEAIVHPKVNQGVDGRVDHCHPVDAQVGVLGDGHSDDLLVVVGVEKVDVVRQPTDSKSYHDKAKHFHNLEI